MYLFVQVSLLNVVSVRFLSVIVGDVVVVFHHSRVFYSGNPPQLFIHSVARHLGCLQLGLSTNEGSRPIL